MQDLIQLLTNATDEERESLAKLLGDDNCTIEGLVEAFQKNATSLIGYHLRDKRPTYREIVVNVAKKVGVDTTGNVDALELAIIKRLWTTVWDQMSPQQRTEFNAQLLEESKSLNTKGLGGLGLTGASLLGAHLSGFAVYLLASSTLGALTAGMGIVLPFVAYSTMSQVISLVIGPAGWIGFGLLVFHKLTGPDYTRITQAVVMVHCIRARIERDRQRVKVKRPWIAVAVAVGVILFLGVWQSFRGRLVPLAAHSTASLSGPDVAVPGPSNTAPLTEDTHNESLTVGEYLFVTRNQTRAEGTGTLKISKGGRTISQIQGGFFELSGFSDQPEGWRNGSDINGDSIPEVVVSEYSGGAHCCTTWHVFALATSAKEIIPIESTQSDSFPFKDLNHDGQFEFIAVDSTFSYWRSDFANSPMMPIIYTFRNGHYEFAPDLMRRTPLTDDQLRDLASKVDWQPDNRGDDVPPEIINALVNLTTQGNATQIGRYVELAWPSDRPGAEAFLQAFKTQLGKSSHASELLILNGSL